MRRKQPSPRWQSTALVHSGVIAAFGYQFVHLGQFPAELHALFAKGFEPRISADYGPDTVDPSVAREMVANAEQFLAGVISALGKDR